MRASKKVKGAVLLTAGAALFLGAPTVYADSVGGNGGSGGNAGSKGSNTTSGSGGILGGLQLLNNADLNVPATVCGVGAILALGGGHCETTAGNNGGGSGGNGGKAVSGKSTDDDATSTAKGGNGGNGGSGGSKGNNTTSGRGSILGGLQVGNNLSANVPVSACGVGALLARGTGKCDVDAGNTSGGKGGNGGSAKSAGDSDGDSSATGGDGGNGGNAGSKGNNTTSGAGSILGGAQVLNNADLNIPITLCGVALLAASAGCAADVSAGNGSGGAGGNGGWAHVNGTGVDGVGGTAVGGDGGNGGNGGSKGNNTTSGAGSILGGLQLLNNADLNVPVTVCGLALLGRAGCSVSVSAGNNGGGAGGNGGAAVVGDETDDTGVGGVHKSVQATAVRGATKLPHTGAAGLALIPFGMALVGGGVAMRRRAAVKS